MKESKIYEKGKYYEVPTVYDPAYFEKNMPVLLPMHHDAELLNIYDYHFHYDYRFFSPKDFISQIIYAKTIQRIGLELYWNHGTNVIHNMILAVKHPGTHIPFKKEDTKRVKPEIIYRKMKCYRTHLRFPSVTKFSKKLKSYVGKKATNWICPHKGYDLSNTAPIEGKIVCPCHGLTFDAKTQICISEHYKP